MEYGISFFFWEIKNMWHTLACGDFVAWESRSTFRLSYLLKFILIGVYPAKGFRARCRSCWRRLRMFDMMAESMVCIGCEGSGCCMYLLCASVLRRRLYSWGYVNCTLSVKSEKANKSYVTVHLKIFGTERKGMWTCVVKKTSFKFRQGENHLAHRNQANKKLNQFETQKAATYCNSFGNAG